MAELTRPFESATLFDRMAAWRTEHQRIPRTAYCSPLVAARIATRLMEETGGMLPLRADGVLVNMLGCDWFEDPTLSGEDVRFEA